MGFACPSQAFVHVPGGRKRTWGSQALTEQECHESGVWGGPSRAVAVIRGPRFQGLGRWVRKAAVPRDPGDNLGSTSLDPRGPRTLCLRGRSFSLLPIVRWLPHCRSADRRQSPVLVPWLVLLLAVLPFGPPFAALCAPSRETVQRMESSRPSSKSRET